MDFLENFHMDLLEIFEDWKSEAREDLVRAERGASFEDWNQVMYYCQQAIEKLVKGLHIILLNKKIPLVHEIGFIVRQFEDKLTKQLNADQLALFEQLSSFYRQDRYLYFKREKFVYGKLDSLKILSLTKEAFEWLLKFSPIPTTTASERLRSSPKP